MKKKFIIFCFVLIACFLIFKFTFNSKLDYLAIGDELSIGKSPFFTNGKSFTDYFAQFLKNKKKLKSYNNFFSYENYRITELIRDINGSKQIIKNNKKITINKAIVDAEIITISMGMNELVYKLHSKNLNTLELNEIYKYIDEMFNDMCLLLENIRKYNDCEIYIIGYYSPFNNLNIAQKETYDKIFNYINKKFNSLEINNKTYYIDIYEGFSQKLYYLPNNKIYYPSLEGYNYISNKIIEKYERK